MGARVSQRISLFQDRLDQRRDIPGPLDDPPFEWGLSDSKQAVFWLAFTTATRFQTSILPLHADVRVRQLSQAEQTRLSGAADVRARPGAGDAPENGSNGESEPGQVPLGEDVAGDDFARSEEIG